MNKKHILSGPNYTFTNSTDEYFVISAINFDAFEFDAFPNKQYVKLLYTSLLMPLNDCVKRVSTQLSINPLE